MNPRKRIQNLISEAVSRAVSEGLLPPVEVGDIEMERPKRREHGDWSTNIAMAVAGRVGKKPREVAEAVLGCIQDDPGLLSGVEIAGPGFINFHLSPATLRNVLLEVGRKGPMYGSSNTGKGRKVQVEFVSANPVGPLHVGHGRWAAFGDTLANVMAHCGYDVEREFYINDYGTQIRNFGKSISARYLELLGQQVEFPEGGYAGHYVTEIARRIVAEHGDEFKSVSEEDRVTRFVEMEYPRMLESIRETLVKMSVDFDAWFSERELYDRGEVSETLDELKGDGYAYEKEGALWLRTSSFGDEKDRVLVRSNEEPTYFASDIAYHHDKIRRGFEILIDVWGADHHGYVPRMKAAMAAMGYDPECLVVVLGQLVKLFRSGEPVIMSKRTGEIVTLDELLEEVGVDAARYFFLQRSHDSPLEFDIELAKKESPENPVYYVQYAHARICSILNYSGISESDISDPKGVDLELLGEEAEFELLRKISELEEVVEYSAQKYVPHRLTGYAEELASLFHAFYRDCRVVTDDEGLTRARLFLVSCARRVLAVVLGLLGVTAPEKM
ncbi:MAG: arginine--tRNA ligase [Actinobacteria bacterium]|nr:arginine--tRNA ligase [Actinomycetota bacterium]